MGRARATSCRWGARSRREPKAAEPAAQTAGPPSTTVPKENDHGSCKSIRRPHRHYRRAVRPRPPARSEEHTSELQSLMRISYAVFCLKKKTQQLHKQTNIKQTC